MLHEQLLNRSEALLPFPALRIFGGGPGTQFVDVDFFTFTRVDLDQASKCWRLHNAAPADGAVRLFPFFKGSPAASVGQVRPGRGGQWPPRSTMHRAIRLVVERNR